MRGLIVMLIVLFCFSLACVAVAVLAKQSGRLTENVQHEIDSRNTAIMRLVR